MVIKVGDRVGILLLTGSFYKKTHKIFNYICDCGKVGAASHSNLLRKTTRPKSCGCLNSTHGKSSSRAYSAWQCMMKRCYNPKTISYSRYGGSGITVCDKWHNFENFYNDMGDCPDNFQLDRINNSIGYSKDNSRWVSYYEQCRNRKTNVFIEINGVKKTLTDWAKIYNIPQALVYTRINRLNWNPVDAVTKSRRRHPKMSDDA